MDMIINGEHVGAKETFEVLNLATLEMIFASIFFSYFANLDYREKVLKDDDADLVKRLRKPLGVVSTITPWNFPLAILSWKLAPSLLAGNTVVSRPASFTPLSTLKLIEVLNQALPPGVPNALSGPGSLGAAMAQHHDIRKISFTGSVEVGKSVMRDGFAWADLVAEADCAEVQSA